MIDFVRKKIAGIARSSRQTVRGDNSMGEKK
jgi:hypothetical protein